MGAGAGKVVTRASDRNGGHDASLALADLLVQFDAEVANAIDPEKPRHRPVPSPRRTGARQAGTVGGSAPAVCPSCAFLASAGFSVRLLRLASRQAASNGTTAAAEMIAHGKITADAYFRALAARLGATFHERADIAAAMTEHAGPRHAPPMDAPVMWCRMADGGAKWIAAPDPSDLSQLSALARRGHARLGLTTPRTMRDLLADQHRASLLDHAIRRLAYAKPTMSAHSGGRFWQGVSAAIVCASAVAAFFALPSLATIGLATVLSVFFFSCVMVRVLAAVAYRPLSIKPLTSRPSRDRPVYSVLVCLYRESAVVPDLIASLDRLNWPRSKLQVLLVCEADDRPTLDALADETLPANFETVLVPAAHPRTKPKALNYALAFARGELLTIYDAEDRPHPDQLEEAWQTFAGANDRVACLQAPLVKANTGRNALTALFHLEYAGLFHGLMPWLVRASSPILLGGTSNHFRRAVLEAVGGWDPFNVTEDADLGLRLWRSGYRTAMLSRPTLEDAPHTLAAWIPQRTRWFKGWMQTWIVHTREPARLWRNMDARAFWITQILLSGTFMSALLHPLVLINAIALTVWLGVEASHDASMTWMAWLDWGMIVSSYLAFGALCWRATEPDQRRAIGWRIALIPLYWLAQSYAAWRALFQLSTRPFEWEKTPHGAHQNSYRRR